MNHFSKETYPAAVPTLQHKIWNEVMRDTQVGQISSVCWLAGSLILVSNPLIELQLTEGTKLISLE